MSPKVKLSNILGRSVTACVLFGAVCWVVLLISSSAQLHGNGATNVSVNFGPLILDKLTQHVTSNGTSATISLEKGLLAYVALWILVGLSTGLVIYKTSRR